MSFRKPLLNFINNQWQPPKSAQYIENLNPATGELLTQIPKSGALDVSAAVEAAQLAFKKWSRTSYLERADFLEAVAAKIEDKIRELAYLESVDTGKPFDLALRLDIPRAIANFRFFAQAVRQSSTTFHEMPNAINYTLRRPIGVAGLITPWNLPLYLLSWKLAPALVMGNTVVAKPSELTPLTADALAQIFLELGAPAGIFNVVQGLGAEAGEALVTHPKVPLISFTGGTITGRRVASGAAPHFKKVSLELGGKNPTIVFADNFNSDTVKGIARASFLNQGQICLCGSRILVEKSIHDEFVRELSREVKTWKMGPPQDEGVQLGSLISEAHLQKVQKYVQWAKDDGGTIAFGGQRAQVHGRGAFFEPTIITNLLPTCRSASEEIFGPVVTVHPFTTESEVVELANSLPFGLSASVWTLNLNRAHRLAHDLEAGTVWVNTWLLRDLRVPFGGMKESGIGREGGNHSLDFFSEAKTVCIQLGENA